MTELHALDESYTFGGGVSVFGTHTVPGLAPVLGELQEQNIPQRLAEGDPTLWGPDATEEAQIRLGWLQLPASSRDLLEPLDELRAQLLRDGLTRVVLAGMGGSSLAPEVICSTLGVELTVLDTTDPSQIRASLTDRLHETLVVVSSKSGGTIETDSQRRAYWQAFLDAGIAESEIGQHFVIVTDPGSPLDATARQMKARAVFHADSTVGGRYSALSAFGLVPSALAGVDVAPLLDEAANLGSTLSEGGPAAALGAALGVYASARRDKLVLADDGTGITGLGDWIEQLIAESTGKDGRGILPVVVSSPEEASLATQDCVVAATGGSLDLAQDPAMADFIDLSVRGPLGAQFLLWEYATAIAGHLLQIDPFNQPNVTESKENTARILTEKPPTEKPVFSKGAVEVYGSSQLLDGVSTVTEALRALVHRTPQHGYVAVMAYLDRIRDADIAALRQSIASSASRPATFGWGPRFLHSTGQYHKGGPQDGVFLQITGACAEDLDIPEKPYTFATLQAAQAAGDREALTGRDRPVLHLHLTDRTQGIAELFAAVEDM